MKAASAALLLAHCAQVSCFVAPVPAAVPGAQRPRGAPSAVGGLLQARAVRSAAAVRVARPGALQLVAGLGDATSTRPQVLRDATRLTRAVWQSAAALLRSVIVQLAAVLSFLFMSPALAGAAPALDARGPAAIEAPAPDVAASRQARVVLVAQAAVPQATPQEHLAQAWKHTAAAASAAVGEVTSPIQTKFEETLRPLKDTMKPVWDGSFKPTWEGSVKPAWEGTIKPGAEKLAARASTLLHETVDSAKSLVDRVGDKGAAAQGHHDHAHHAGHDADTVYRTKGLSAIRAHGDAELAAHGASAPAATDAEVQARFPDWKKITRSELLHMDLHHHAHDDHDQVAGKGFFATLVTPLTMLFGFVKIMWPLTMLSVPIIWVFPWELITGGFKSSRKFFNDVPGSKEEEATANRTRENVLWASTFLNMVVSVVFGSGGGGGGGHH